MPALHQERLRRGLTIGLAISVPAAIFSRLSSAGEALHPFLVPDMELFQPLSDVATVRPGFVPLASGIVLNGVIHAVAAGGLRLFVASGPADAHDSIPAGAPTLRWTRAPRPRRWAVRGFLAGAAVTVPATSFALLSPTGERLYPYLSPGTGLIRPLVADASANWPGTVNMAIACIANGAVYGLASTAVGTLLVLRVRRRPTPASG